MIREVLRVFELVGRAAAEAYRHGGVLGGIELVLFGLSVAWSSLALLVSLRSEQQPSGAKHLRRTLLYGGVLATLQAVLTAVVLRTTRAAFVALQFDTVLDPSQRARELSDVLTTICVTSTLWAASAVAAAVMGLWLIVRRLGRAPWVLPAVGNVAALAVTASCLLRRNGILFRPFSCSPSTEGRTREDIVRETVERYAVAQHALRNALPLITIIFLLTAVAWAWRSSRRDATHPSARAWLMALGCLGTDMVVFACTRAQRWDSAHLIEPRLPIPTACPRGAAGLPPAVERDTALDSPQLVFYGSDVLWNGWEPVTLAGLPSHLSTWAELMAQLGSKAPPTVLMAVPSRTPISEVRPFLRAVGTEHFRYAALVAAPPTSFGSATLGTVPRTPASYAAALARPPLASEATWGEYVGAARDGR